MTFSFTLSGWNHGECSDAARARESPAATLLASLLLQNNLEVGDRRVELRHVLAAVVIVGPAAEVDVAAVGHHVDVVMECSAFLGVVGGSGRLQPGHGLVEAGLDGGEVGVAGGRVAGGVGGRKQEWREEGDNKKGENGATPIRLFGRQADVKNAGLKLWSDARKY